MSVNPSGETAVDPHAAEHGLGKYIAVFLALIVLTGASFFTYSSLWPFHDQPAVGRLFMMAVSCTKATLVMLFFMHLKWEANWKYVLTIPPAIMAIFIMLALVPDIGLRYRIASPKRRSFMAEPLDVASVEASAHASDDEAHEPAGEH